MSLLVHDHLLVVFAIATGLVRFNDLPSLLRGRCCCTARSGRIPKCMYEYLEEKIGVSQLQLRTTDKSITPRDPPAARRYSYKDYLPGTAVGLRVRCCRNLLNLQFSTATFTTESESSNSCVLVYLCACACHTM